MRECHQRWLGHVGLDAGQSQAWTLTVYATCVSRFHGYLMQGNDSQVMGWCEVYGNNLCRGSCGAGYGVSLLLCCGRHVRVPPESYVETLSPGRMLLGGIRY